MKINIGYRDKRLYYLIKLHFKRIRSENIEEVGSFYGLGWNEFVLLTQRSQRGRERAREIGPKG